MPRRELCHTKSLGIPMRMCSSLTNPSVSGSRMRIMARPLYVPCSCVHILSSHTGTQGTTEDASKDIATFVSIFFENFSSFKGRALHLAGESYGVSPVVIPCPSLPELILSIGTIHPTLRICYLRPECRARESRADAYQFGICYDR